MQIVLLTFHFIGLVMGFAVSISNIVMAGIMAKAEPSERAILGRFPLTISIVGKIGLAILWITGIAMTMTKWNGFAGMPWQFNAKLAFVTCLTITIIAMAPLEKRIKQGDQAAAAKIQIFGKIATLFAVLSLVFAVVMFQ